MARGRTCAARAAGTGADTAANAPRANTPPIRRAGRAARAVVHGIAGLATTIVVFPYLSVVVRRDRIRSWSARLLEILNVDVRVAGALPEGEGNALWVANHVSWLDIFVLNAVQPMRFVAKAELARWPLIGRLVRNTGTLFVQRRRRQDTHRVNLQAAQAFAAGDIVAIFPEGTTTDGSAMLPFRSSLLQPIIDAGGVVRPVAIRYRTTEECPCLAAAYAGETTFLASFWRICGQHALAVDLRVAPGMPVQGRNRRDLARGAEAAIRSELGLPQRDCPPGIRADQEAGPP